MKWLQKMGAAVVALGSLVGYSRAYAQDEISNKLDPAEAKLEVCLREAEISERKSKYTTQEIPLPLTNPCRSPEAHAQLYVGATRAYSKFLEYVSEETGLDKSTCGRTAEVVAGLAGDSLAESVSHELGHKRVAERNGGSSRVKISPFKYGIFSGGHCDWNYDNYISPEEFARDSWAGLNQQTFNAKEISERTRKQRTLIDDISYVGNTLTTALKANSIGDDSDVICGLEDMGLGAGKRDFKRNVTVMTAVNPRLAESCYNICDFIFEGNRVHEPVSAEISDGWKVYLPNPSVYFAPRGMVADVSLPIGNENLSVEAGFRHDLSFAQKDARLHAFQAGAKFNIDTGAFEVSPFAYFGRNDGAKSRVVGARLKVPIVEGLAIEANVSHSVNDLIEQSVEGNDNGLSGFAGITITLK